MLSCSTKNKHTNISTINTRSCCKESAALMPRIPFLGLASRTGGHCFFFFFLGKSGSSFQCCEAFSLGPATHHNHPFSLFACWRNALATQLVACPDPLCARPAGNFNECAVVRELGNYETMNGMQAANDAVTLRLPKERAIYGTVVSWDLVSS